MNEFQSTIDGYTQSHIDKWKRLFYFKNKSNNDIYNITSLAELKMPAIQDICTRIGIMMITPKTDIVQAVGRILRSKHKHCQPCVIDLIDSHDIFKRQYKQRQKFYNQQNYKIVSWNHKNESSKNSDGTYVFEHSKPQLWDTIYDYVDGKYSKISKKD